MLCPIVICILLQVSIASAAVHDVTLANVVADGKTLNTTAIQAVIDACEADGGGTVYFPAGKYLTGTIYLKDNVRLDLAAGAVILGSTNIDDYPIMVCDYPSRVDAYNARALIWGEGLQNVAITGKGTIDGQGAAFAKNKASREDRVKVHKLFGDQGRYIPHHNDLDRPYVIRLIGCRKILVEGITLTSSPMWMQLYQNCDDVTVRGITVYNHVSRNNDMIDIDGCRNVVISDCISDSDDDGVTLKSLGNAPTENVVVTNCILRSHCNAIKAGTESAGGFKNIRISNCQAKPSQDEQKICGENEGISGIALEIVDGGTLENVVVENITIEKTKSPIFLRLGNRARPAKPTDPKPPVGTFRNVVIRNIVATDAGNYGCSILGTPGHCIEDVTLSNIRLECAGGGTKEDATRKIAEREADYPEPTFYGGIFPAYGFFCRHVDGLKFENVKLSHKLPEQRPAWVFDDVSDVSMYNCEETSKKEKGK